MRCKGCPRKKFCELDCRDCDFGIVITRLNRKISKLERQINAVKSEDKILYIGGKLKNG